MMHAQWLPHPIHYDGSQLRAHWIYEQTGLVGDSIVAFVGGARVEAAHMVDLEDRARQAWIASEQMLHVIIEHFQFALTPTVMLQHLFVALVADALRARVPDCVVRRCGNDLFDGEAKLSVSVATASPVSTLIHFGINLLSVNTPVVTRGLAEYGIEPRPFAAELLRAYPQEVAAILHARAKVKSV